MFDIDFYMKTYPLVKRLETEANLLCMTYLKRLKVLDQES